MIFGPHTYNKSISILTLKSRQVRSPKQKTRQFRPPIRKPSEFRSPKQTTRSFWPNIEIKSKFDPHSIVKSILILRNKTKFISIQTLRPSNFRPPHTPTQKTKSIANPALVSSQVRCLTLKSSQFLCLLLIHVNLDSTPKPSWLRFIHKNQAIFDPHKNQVNSDPWTEIKSSSTPPIKTKLISTLSLKSNQFRSPL